MSGTGVILAAPSSGCGKTTVTLGLLRALARTGSAVRGAKSGPDYIDPRFHEAACGAPCATLDAWAMTPDRIKSLAAGDGLLLIEGAMGLFDGAPPDGRGATADLARILQLPVVLVVDAGRMSQSITPLVQGFAGHSSSARVAGVILNRVGSARHEAMLRRALAETRIPSRGALGRRADLELPDRHLGLVQASEHPELDAFLERAADAVREGIDLAALTDIAAPLPAPAPPRGFVPPGKQIAVAHDQAFAFHYPHMLADWRCGGAEISFFSPLADEPVPEADFVFLPGGYPELHANTISHALNFKQSLELNTQNTVLYGECGGYMVLGNTLTDAQGQSHRMAGLLDLETSFAKRRLHLGYRHLGAQSGPLTGQYAGHEFHYATTLRADGTPLFEARDAEGTELPPMGLIQGNVMGSFAHLIDVT